MKITLKERMATFLDQRSHNWQQRLCLITFLMLSLSVVLPPDFVTQKIRIL